MPDLSKPMGPKQMAKTMGPTYTGGVQVTKRPKGPPERQPDYSEREGNPAFELKKIYDQFVARQRQIEADLDSGKRTVVTPEEYEATKKMWFDLLNKGISDKNADKVMREVAMLEADPRYADLSRRFEKLISYGTNWLLKAMGHGVMEDLVEEALNLLLEVTINEEVFKGFKVLVEAGENAKEVFLQLMQSAKFSRNELTDYDIKRMIRDMFPSKLNDPDFFEGIVDVLQAHGVKVIGH